MATVPSFSTLPDDARLWIHTAAHPLSDDTQSALRNRISAFIESWTSHDVSVQGEVAVLENRFLLVAAVRADGNEISGCGKDDLENAVDEVASALDIEWVPALHVVYRSRDGSVETASRGEFQERASEEVITPDTHVFDPSLTSLGALRNGDFETPARESWHSQLLPTPTTA